MIINSTRIGIIEVQEQELVHFPSGVVGLTDWQNAVVVPVPDLPLLNWLQFAHDPSAAFLLLDVQALYPDYRLEFAREQAQLGQDAKVYTIVKVPNGDFTQATTNLMAPIVIEPPASFSDKRQETSDPRRLAQQVILHDFNYPLRHPLFVEEAAC
ncbi:MAG: hypothetical protein FD169_1191 [Bacillota bacterium]|nr:MAG: hypothetical protein FD169_1191 [Bacillota bacterium]